MPFMLDLHDSALLYVKTNGPLIPVQLAKGMKIDITLAGAILSELLAHKQVAMSTAKIGTSKMYYVNGQEEKLQQLYDHLGATPKKAYDLLKEATVLKDIECTPWQRVAYREMKDFAFAFKYNDEIYWRWYLTPEQDALNKIKPPVAMIEPIAQPIAIPSEPAAVLPTTSEMAAVPEAEAFIVKGEVPPDAPLKEKKKRAKTVKKEKVEEPKQQTQLLENSLPTQLSAFIKEHNISPKDIQLVKKHADIEMLATVPSTFGNLHYLLIYLDKKKITDADLSMLYTRGQKKRAPILLVSNGELTKRAEKYLDEEYNGVLVFKQLA